MVGYMLEEDEELVEAEVLEEDDDDDDDDPPLCRRDPFRRVLTKCLDLSRAISV